MTKKLPKLKRYLGERSEIRFFDSENGEDMRRLRVMVEHREVQEMMDSVRGMSKRDLYDWAEERGAYGRFYLFAVSGTKEIFADDSPEIGKVQGFVYLYAGSDERKIIKRLVKLGLISAGRVGEKKVFEISFAKYPKTLGGQIGSAVRQACLEIRRLDRINEGSGVFVFCFIDEKNEASIRVAEACGFERRGKHFYEPDSAEMSALFVLNYTKLGKIEEEKRKNC